MTYLLSAVMISACFLLTVTGMAAPGAVQDDVPVTNDDVVILRNGDRITGEIKRLERGQLYFDTDYVVDPIRIDWEQIERLETDAEFQLSLEDGQRYEGFIRRESDTFEVLGPTGQFVQVQDLDVVEIDPREPGFWQQIDGAVDFGFSFTKDNDQAQSTLHTEANYAAYDYIVSLQADSLFSSQTGASDTSRHDVNMDFKRFFSRNWYGMLLTGLRNSNEQDLDLRTTFGGGGGRDITRTNRLILSAAAGVQFSREKYSPESGQELQKQAEGLVGLDFSAFTFDSSQFGASLNYYPELSSSGRYRIDFNSNFRLDLVGDFYWNFSFFDNYDSDPPGDSPGNDLGITTSFGLTF